MNSSIVFFPELKKNLVKTQGHKNMYDISVRIDLNPFYLMFDIRERKKIVTNLVELALSMYGTEYIFWRTKHNAILVTCFLASK